MICRVQWDVPSHECSYGTEKEMSVEIDTHLKSGVNIGFKVDFITQEDYERIQSYMEL